jgi:hypothetical protein
VNERRYILTFLIGPCTQDEAEDLLLDLSGLNGVRALGGAGSLASLEEPVPCDQHDAGHQAGWA